MSKMDKGLLTIDYLEKESFVDDLKNKKRAVIAPKVVTNDIIISFCKINPKLQLYLSRKKFFLTANAIAFRPQFDHKLFKKINKM